MKIIGKTRVYKNQYGRYNATISMKNAEGKYENAYIALQFKKGQEPQTQDIEITDAFLSFYKDKDMKSIFKIVVMAYKSDELDYKNVEQDEDLPF